MVKYRHIPGQFVEEMHFFGSFANLVFRLWKT
jgi:hypothetical protein